jgi:NADPH2:quinone reductase
VAGVQAPLLRDLILRLHHPPALALVAAGRLRAVVGQTFPLEQAAAVHAALEKRQTLGKTLLLTERAA